MITLTCLNGSLWFLNIHDAVPLFHMKWPADLQVFWQSATPLLKLKRGWETISFRGNCDPAMCFGLIYKYMYIFKAKLWN